MNYNGLVIKGKKLLAKETVANKSCPHWRPVTDQHLGGQELWNKWWDITIRWKGDKVCYYLP